MKDNILGIMLMFIMTPLWSQKSLFGEDLQRGNYHTGYQDTIFFNESQSYSFRDYEGNKPHFVGIWFPLEEEPGSGKMVLQDYFEPDKAVELISLRDSLAEMNRTSLINYGLKNRLDHWEDREMDDNLQSLLDAMLKTTVNAYSSSEYPANKSPVVVYHHGMGGSLEENFVLFEFLASYGFVVISSNYHWPDQGIGMDEIQNDLKAVVDFAYHLPYADPEQIYFLGHSWGTQVGLVLNQQGDHPIKTFFLLDTTLEQMPLDRVGMYYPELDSVFRNHSNDFRTKTYVITSPKAFKEKDKLVWEPDPAFEAFKLINTDQFDFLLTRDVLSHSAFVSMGVLRGVYLDEFNQDDSVSMVSQYSTYLELNAEILELLKEENISSTFFHIIK